MKLQHDKIVNNGTSILWDDVGHLRLLNDKLVLVLKDHSTIELPVMHPGTIDEVFRVYEQYLREKPKDLSH